MKRLITPAFATLCALSLSAEADVLAGWYGAPGGPNTAAAGISGNFDGGDGGRSANSSSDGTYGPGPSTGESGAVQASNADPQGAVDGVITTLRSGTSNSFLTITNNTGDDIALETIVWDMFVADNAGGSGANTFQIDYFSGDLTDAASTLVLLNVAGIDGVAFPTTGSPDDFQDYSLDLTSVLTDNVLADGESATFRFRETGSGGPPIFVDNTAVLGVIPEPGSLALLGLGGLLVARRRRVF